MLLGKEAAEFLQTSDDAENFSVHQKPHGQHRRSPPTIVKNSSMLFCSPLKLLLLIDVATKIP